MHTDVFIQFLSSEKHYSPHTVKAYENDLDQFLTFARETYGIEDIAKVNHQIIRSWMASLIQNGQSARSVNRKMSALKSFYRFLIKRNLSDENPMQKIIAPKLSKKLPVFIENDKMDLLFDESFCEPNFKSMRSRLILELLYATGMRVSELIALREEDINMESMTMLVHGKRNKQRLIPFSPSLINLIQDYIDLKRKEIGDSSGNTYLIVTDKGSQSYPKMIYNIVTQSLRKVTTQHKVSPHVIRHTFATVMLNNGADLNAIKELLGHANLSATQVYTHNTIERIKQIYQQAHPKA